MSKSVSPSDGLGVVHLFYRVHPQSDCEAIRSAVDAAIELGDQVVPVAIVGHKADVAFMVIGEDLWRLRDFQTALVKTGLELVDSYLSLTEISEYAQGVPDEMKQARLRPVLPPDDKPAWCFYPMSKRRNVGANWFKLPYDERYELMMEHGKSGRTFAGRILQVVTGSTGVDDYEWGVTLFGQHPDDLKDAVYTMRYDRASALYGEFGTFYTGMVDELEVVLTRVGCY